jgi:hypothetical protein
MKLCPNCEQENPTVAKVCMHCGTRLTPNEKLDEKDKLQNELSEIKKTNELLKSALESQLEKKKEKPEKKQEELIPPPSTLPPIVQPRPLNKKSIGLIIVLVAVALIVFGMFYYSNIYLPAKIDREAARYYTFANATNLRSSKEAGADYNRIASLAYGSELITYEHDFDWSKVKDKDGNKGYVSSDYLLAYSDFSILNNTFGDTESKQCINTAKCRIALLNYYKNNSLSDNWKVFCRPKDTKPNAVFFPRLYNKNSKFTDFAVIIKNTQTGERKTLIFGFNDDESVSWSTDFYAPSEGYIENIYINPLNGDITVKYSN